MIGSIGKKLTLFTGIAIAIGLVAVVSFYTREQEKNILAQNERAVQKVTESVIQGLQTVMLAGYADVAEVFAERLKQVGDVLDFRILRVGGIEAFKDNKTIDDVNKRRGQEDFQPRDEETVVRVLAADDPQLKKLVETKSFLFYYEEVKGERALTFLWPIVNERQCHKCHGQANPLRGVLKLTTSLAAVDEDVKYTWIQAALILAGAVVLIVVITGMVLKRSIVDPIVKVSAAMRLVSKGDLDQEVPVFGKDELSEMAVNFNAMTDELRRTYVGYKTEHDKLSTIILGSRDGIVVTNSEGKIVLATPSALGMLGKTEAQVLAEDFDHLLDDPERMRACLAQADTSREASIFEYKEKTIAIYAANIRTDGGLLIGSAALLRDITEEKRLEKQLRALSDTDGLTGLFNRRYLDKALAKELERCRRYGMDLSIMMFDIDHFKKFNDTYGHDQGDRVLKAVAAEIRKCVRLVDVPCRYGGEEFFVILTETAEPGAITVAERLRKSVEEMRVDGLQVTITVGVGDWKTVSAEKPEQLLGAADMALYEGKRGGRNRVVISTRAHLEAKEAENKAAREKQEEKRKAAAQ